MVVNGISHESVTVAPIFIYLLKRKICRWQYWTMHQNFVKMQDNISSSQEKLYHVFCDSLAGLGEILSDLMRELS
jgi:hypothetical protein